MGLWLMGGACTPKNPSVPRSDAHVPEDGITHDSGTSDPGNPDTGIVSDAGIGPANDGDIAACVSIQERAAMVYAPVDILWVVDNSPSMAAEAARVQANLNAFAEAMEHEGIDYHVMVITDGGYERGVPGVPFVDLRGTALGSNANRYRFIDHGVNSNNALSVVLDLFTAPTEYEPGRRFREFIRPDSVVHLVVVTDDESGVEPAEFRRRFEWNLQDIAMRAGAVRPTHRDEAGTATGFTLHAICSQDCATDPNAPECCAAGTSSCTRTAGMRECVPPGANISEGAAAPGSRYVQLQRQTGGRWFSICTPATAWTSLFSALTSSVIVQAAVPCRFAIPAPPNGQTLDPNRVNVVFAHDREEILPRVDREGACGQSGWYYDDPSVPTQVTLCPTSCASVAAHPESTVRVAFGCDTVLF